MKNFKSSARSRLLCKIAKGCIARQSFVERSAVGCNFIWAAHPYVLQKMLADQSILFQEFLMQFLLFIEFSFAENARYVMVRRKYVLF